MQEQTEALDELVAAEESEEEPTPVVKEDAVLDVAVSDIEVVLLVDSVVLDSEMTVVEVSSVADEVELELIKVVVVVEAPGVIVRVVDRVPERTPPVKDGSNGEVAGGAAVALGLAVPIGVGGQLKLERGYTLRDKRPPGSPQ